MPRELLSLCTARINAVHRSTIQAVRQSRAREAACTLVQSPDRSWAEEAEGDEWGRVYHDVQVPGPAKKKRYVRRHSARAGGAFLRISRECTWWDQTSGR